MYRKHDYGIEIYDSDGIKIKPVGVNDDTAVGGWSECYDWLALTYLGDKERNMTYSDIAYKMTVGKEIIGYFIAQTAVCTEDDGFLKKSDKKLVLYDLSLDSEDKVKHGKILIDYLLYVAKKRGCSAVEIPTRNEFLLFRCFIECHYDVTEQGECSYIKTESDECNPETEYLCAYDDDAVSLEDLYFLWGMKFDIERERCVRSFDEGKKISVDRKSGRIRFSRGVVNLGGEIFLNARTRNLVHYVVREWVYSGTETIYLGKKIDEVVTDACTDTELCVFDLADNVTRNFHLGYVAHKQGYSAIWAYLIRFNMNDCTYNEDFARVPIERQILTNACYVDRERGMNMREEMSQRRRAAAFMEKLNGMLRVDFCFGEGEGAKRLSLIFGDKVRAEHNGTLDNAEVEYDRSAVIAQMCLLHFENWNTEYVGDSEDESGAWEITLSLRDDEMLTYKGKGAYPKIWFVVKDVVEQYSGHVINP